MKKPLKKTIAFIDGQNLFYSIKNSFGYEYPNYDVKKLANLVCKKQNWRLTKTSFYTGIPKQKDNPFWHYFWSSKISTLKRKKNVSVYYRFIHQNKNKFECPYCKKETFFKKQDEKGIDVRIAIDVLRAVLNKKCDVILLFSQDQDFAEVADEIRQIAKERGHFVKIASAFPENSKQRGINKTDWIPFDKTLDPLRAVGYDSPIKSTQPRYQPYPVTSPVPTNVSFIPKRDPQLDAHLYKNLPNYQAVPSNKSDLSNLSPIQPDSQYKDFNLPTIGINVDEVLGTPDSTRVVSPTTVTAVGSLGHGASTTKNPIAGMSKKEQQAKFGVNN